MFDMSLSEVIKEKIFFLTFDEKVATEHWVVFWGLSKCSLHWVACIVNEPGKCSCKLC